MNDIRQKEFEVIESAFFKRSILAEGSSRPFRRVIPENECLIRQLRNKILRYTGISLVEIHDVHLWMDKYTMCLFDSYWGVYDSLTLEYHGLDWNRAGGLPVVDVPGTTVLLPQLDTYNYYHWLIDTVPCFGVLEMAGIDVSAVDQIYIHQFAHEFQRNTLEVMHIDPKTVMSHQNRENHYVFEKLLIPDFRLNGFGWPNPWLASYLNDKFSAVAEQSIVSAPKCSGGKLYIARGPSRRSVVNENELIDGLTNLGYQILHPHKSSIVEQVHALKNADFVLAPHGAGLANIVFCKPGTKVIEFGGHYITEHFRVLSEYCNLEYRSFAAGVDASGNRLQISDSEAARELDFMADLNHIVNCSEAFYQEFFACAS